MAAPVVIARTLSFFEMQEIDGNRRYTWERETKNLSSYLRGSPDLRQYDLETLRQMGLRTANQFYVLLVNHSRWRIEMEGQIERLWRALDDLRIARIGLEYTSCAYSVMVPTALMHNTFHEEGVAPADRLHRASHETMWKFVRMAYHAEAEHFDI